MKIIDADVHISAQGGHGRITVEELIKYMDEYNVDQAITWPMVSYRREVAEDNRAIAEGIKKYPQRIIGFGGLNPMLGIEQTMQELQRCIDQYGFCGFKLNGARDNYYIDDEHIAFPVFEKIAEHKLILALHCGINDPVHTHPWRIGNIAKAFPEIPILMVHMGGAGSPGLYDEAIKTAKINPNIFLVGSEADPKAIIQAIDEVGPERICYASDTPFSLMPVSLAIYKVILKELPSSHKELIMGGNILRLLTQNQRG